MPLWWARDSFGGILGNNLGEGNCESKIVSRQWGVNPKGPNLEKIQDRLKFSISLENFNPDLQNSPQK